VQHLDLQVVQQAAQWSRDGLRVWLCTVLCTYGSAPRAPGSLLAVSESGQWVGSLSGGCVEEDFLERVAAGEFVDAVAVVRYGDGSDTRSNIRLPCGGMLDVLVENLPADCDTQAHLAQLESALLGQRRLLREVNLRTGARQLHDDQSQGRGWSRAKPACAFASAPPSACCWRGTRASRTSAPSSARAWALKWCCAIRVTR
jgi:xanthine dehydrogenase accessory factor